MEPEIRYCKTDDGVSIAYYTMGEGHPLVVASNVLWSHLRVPPFLEYYRGRGGRGLGRGLQIVRYDARGTGLSDRQSLDFSIEARLRDLDAVVQRLELTRFAIFSTAHGSPAAVAYTVAHPERVSHLVLADAYARGRDFLKASSVWGSLRETADEHWEHFTLVMANSNLGFTNSEAAQAVASLYRESMTIESLRAFFASLEVIDVTPLLPHVSVPTLVMNRPPSGKTMLESSREVASKIPNARFVPVTGRAGPMWTDEDTRTVEEFLGLEQDAAARTRSTALPSGGRKAGASRTIIYTDVEGNTGILQRLGDDGWRAVLRDHERITREVLAAHRGTEVKTMGDGFMASFDSATSAVECAIDLQRSFAARNVTAAERLLVRVGLNAGEPIEEDDDLFGTAVTMAARIMAQGAGGEILTSDLVRGLVAGKSFAFTDRGEFVMKGFDDAVRLYEVRWREQ